jgi:hypothetical protein
MCAIAIQSALPLAIAAAYANERRPESPDRPREADARVLARIDWPLFHPDERTEPGNEHRRARGDAVAA